MSGKNIGFDRYKTILTTYLKNLEGAESLDVLKSIQEKHAGNMKNKITRGYTEGQREELKSINENIKEMIRNKTAEFSGASTPVKVKQADLTAVVTHIKLLECKAEYFLIKSLKAGDYSKRKAYRTAYKAVKALVTDIEGFLDCYKDDNNLSLLKQSVKQRLNENEHSDVKLLQGHRGCAEVLVNLLAAVLCLPVYAAVAAYKGTLFPVKVKTDSAVKLDNIKQSMDEVMELDDSDATNGVASPENNSSLAI